MEITIDYEEVMSSRVDKNYRLLVGKKEIEVEVNKWWFEGFYNDSDNDYTIIDEDKIKKQLSEKEYDNLLDYINELN